MSAFKNLFSPIKIGNLALKNRGIMPPMVTNLCNEDGSVTDSFIAFHVARSKGGVALNIIEAAYVDQCGKGFVNQCGIDNDGLLPGLTKLAKAVHDTGGKIAIQLFHGGRQANAMFAGTIVAPSPIACLLMRTMPHELTPAEIKGLVQKFAQAADRAKKAGFDAVEIHGAHGYLINQFLSPRTNHRNDEYGGSPEKRTKFPLEVVAAVRAQVGGDFPVIYRITADEFLPDGLSVRETAPFCKLLVEHGVDAINVSGSTYETRKSIAGADEAIGLFVSDAQVIKETIKGAIPVAVANRIKTPAFADQIIREGKTDMVAMGRAVLCDADFYSKAEAGMGETIRTCLSCNYCISELMSGRPVGCLYNPMTGNETKYDIGRKTQNSKNVVVVGGGLAGMEAANTAAIKGHKVTLFEATGELGGNILPGVKPPFKSEMLACVDYEKRMLLENEITVHLNTLVDSETLAKLGADKIIVATGSHPIIPDIPGSDEAYVCFAEDVLLGKVKLGATITVIGGGSVGIETAGLLSAMGKQVTVFEMTDKILHDVAPALQGKLLGRIAKTPTKIFLNETVKEIKNHQVITDKQVLARCDTVVLAVGYRSENALANKLTEQGVPFILVGDAVKPRKINDAVAEGFEAGLNID